MSLRMLLAVGFLLAGLNSQAQMRSASGQWPLHDLSQHQAQLVIGAHMEVYRDPDHSAQLAGILSLDRGWESIEKKSPNFGFTEVAHWFRFRVNNSSNQSLNRLLVLPVPFLDQVDLYHFAGTGKTDPSVEVGPLLQEYNLGDTRPFAERPVRHQDYVMPLELPPGESLIVLRVATDGTVEAPLTVWEPNAFFSTSYQHVLLQGVFAGILFIMALYNLFLFFSIRDLSYLYFVGYALSFLLFSATLRGFGYAYLWPESVQWNSYAISTFIASSAFFCGLFTLHFLRLRTVSRAGFYLLLSLTIANGVLLVSSFFLPYMWTLRVGAILGLPTGLVALILGFHCWYRGYAFARWYGIAWSTALLGVATLLIQKFGLLPTNVWTEFGAQFCIVMQTALLSFALADSINEERKLRMKAQADVLQQEHATLEAQTQLLKEKDRANERLEHEVTERTRELKETLSKLEAANLQLQHLSSTDSLTGLHNRNYFDSAYDKEFRRCQRQGTELVLMFLDIDFFKRVNDEYGHLAGDECLAQVASILGHNISRASDLIARYGGEEFVVLLPEVDIASGIEMAEKIRLSVAETPLEVKGTSLNVTVSIGVASLNHSAMSTPQGLVDAADQALYMAKKRGRNRVCQSAQHASGGAKIA